MPKPRVSEVTSYIFIKNELKNIGWNTSNPSRNTDGEVYTQQECLDNSEIKNQLQLQRPEYVLKVREDKFYIIEAKATLEQINDAYKEARDYAQQINRSSIISAPIISGVAGNDEDGYIVKSGYLQGTEYAEINYHSKQITSLISKSLALELVANNNASIPDLHIDESRMVKVAEHINEVLHGASINKDERAYAMAALLLAMLDDTLPNYNANPTVFINDINSRAKSVLEHYGKADFYKYIEIRLPTGEEAQVKFKQSLVKTMYSLLKIDIKACMNSGSDVLGKFYEVFLKYGDGAKDIGIVLTPRHISQFAARIMNITHRDIVYDPTCGTGGFLVAAYDYVRDTATKEQLEIFKNYRVFGVDLQPKASVLAIVNMIFRGDGKNNIVNNNCLSQSLKASMIDGNLSAKYIPKSTSGADIVKPVTKVLMNPPFALKDSDEKEYKFVQHALDQMEDGGLLFSILPVSVMTKSRACYEWRKNVLLHNNTLLAVITFPEDLFYPVAVNTCGVFIKKGQPHPKSQKILWIRAKTDGYSKQKGKRLPDARLENNLIFVEPIIKSFINDTSMEVSNIPQYIKSCAIEWNNAGDTWADSDLELIPEAFLDTCIPSNDELSAQIEKQFREYVAYIIRNKKEGDLDG